MRGRFAGEIVEPGDEGYHQARIVWNAIVDRHPALIVRPISVDDVVSAIQFAQDKGLVVAVRGGGHSAAGFSTCDDGMVIDLSGMREVTVDPDSKRARAQGGAHLSRLDTAAQAHGLVCPVGVVGHTGVAGLTLGGGMGRLQRRFGLTIDNLVAVDLVTADGEGLHVDEVENSDLFWGLRGAGANFGVATSFEFRLHPLGGTVLQGMVAFPVERSLEVAGHVREFVATHQEVHTALAFTKDGDRPVFMVGATHAGSLDDAERDLAVFRSLRPLADTFGAKPYLEVQRMADESSGWGQRFYTKAGFLAELSDEVVGLCAGLAETIPPGAELSLWAQGGAIGRVSDDAMAYTGRNAPFADAVRDDVIAFDTAQACRAGLPVRDSQNGCQLGEVAAVGKGGVGARHLNRGHLEGANSHSGIRLDLLVQT